MIEDISINVTPETAADPQKYLQIICDKRGLKFQDINAYRLIKKSIDARRRNVMVNLMVRVATGDDLEIDFGYKPVDYCCIPENAPTLIIVGSGPAGLFAALKAIELGIKPILIERGSDVDNRRKELADISRKSSVNPNTNYCFGEGGAGAYSDGKLYTRSKKRGNIREVLNILHQFGAKEEILIDAHPHIGSDKLPEIIKNIRETIIAKGGEVHFNERMTDLIIANGEAKGIVSERGNKYFGAVILATGHSARDVYRLLRTKGIEMEAKGLAIGVRLEHPQALIDSLQYHSKEGRGKYLPPAEYSFVTQSEGRGVYSFCMCPGGVIVPAMTSPQEIVVNGMSASGRSGKWANSGMVVELHPGDIRGYSNAGQLEMMSLQEDLEKKFFEASGHSYNIPAQGMKDFTEGKDTKHLPATSYPNGNHPARLDKLLPKEISSRLQKGFKDFDKKCPGFLTNEAVVMGLESRTSSPVRIPRNPETLQHIHIRNLYPAGEGAGYSGGIVSAAIDGIRTVEAYAHKINKIN